MPLICLKRCGDSMLRHCLYLLLVFYSQPCLSRADAVCVDVGLESSGLSACLGGHAQLQDARCDRRVHVPRSLFQRTFAAFFAHYGSLDTIVSPLSAKGTAAPKNESEVLLHANVSTKVAGRPRGRGRAPGGDGGGGGSKKVVESGEENTGAATEDAHKEEPYEPVLARMNKEFTSHGAFIFTTIFLLFSGYLLYQLGKLYSQYRRVHMRHGRRTNWNFIDYVKYRFAHWFAWQTHAAGKVLLALFAVFVFVGAFAYCALTNTNIKKSCWKIFIWLVSPDAGQLERSIAGAWIGALVSLGGLFIFALMLTLVQDGFNKYLEGLKEGRLPVYESRHIVLIGYTDQTIPLLQELSMAYENSGGITIAILSEEAKPTVESEIQAANVELGKSKVVVRCGQAHDIVNLKHVAVDTCSCAILMPDPKVEEEHRDSFVLRIFVLLRGQGWPLEGRIIAVCSLKRNRALFEQMGGTTTDLVMPGHFVAKLMVQASRQWGLGTVIKTTFSFEGSEFYIVSVPEQLVGCCFLEACFYYPDAVLCGIMRDDGSGKQTFEWCPDKDYKLQQQDEIVLLAEQDEGAKPTKTPSTRPTSSDLGLSCQSIPILPMKREDPEKIIFVGWNELIGLMLPEVDLLVPPKSEAIIFAPRPKAYREEYLDKIRTRWSRPLANISKVIHVEGQIGARYQLEEMVDEEKVPIRLEEAARIFILADNDSPTAAHADACTVTSILQIHDIILSRGKASFMPIIPQIRDPVTMKYCTFAKISDFVDSCGVHAQILAMAAYQPRIMTVLEDIISEDGHVDFCIRGIEEYLSPGEDVPETISFFQAWCIASTAGDIAVGWSKPFVEGFVDGSQSMSISSGRRRRGIASMSTNRPTVISDWEHQQVERISERISSGTLASWEMNPRDKASPRMWDTDRDKLVVVSRHRDSTIAQSSRSSWTGRFVRHSSPCYSTNVTS